MGENRRPTVYILSDSIGETAYQVARACMSQFEPDTFELVRPPKITNRQQLETLVRGTGARVVFFYTFAEPALREEMERLVEQHSLSAVDIMGPAVEHLAQASGQPPTWESGVIRRTDRGYFRRIEALEFAVMHDDGRHPEDLTDAEIVLVGVSRTSKTPLSMYLAFQGYKVANIPLMLEVDAPDQLFEVDPRRVFGLVSEPHLLAEIRRQRAHELGGYARRYAEPDYVLEEMDHARALMKRLGVIIVHTDSRAVEEAAQEVIRHLEAAVSRS